MNVDCCFNHSYIKSRYLFWKFEKFIRLNVDYVRFEDYLLNQSSLTVGR